MIPVGVGSTVYIAGPMRAFRNDCYNFVSFFHWQHVLEQSGYVVINPAYLDCMKALYSEWHFTDDKYDAIMTEDLELISSQADWLFALKGWELSEGAMREIDHAKRIGIPVFYEDICGENP